AVRLILLAFLAVAIPGTHTAFAQDTTASAPVPAMSAADAQQLIATLQDPARRAALIATLQNLQKIVPPAPPTTAQTTIASPGAAPVAPAPNNLGAQLVAHGTRLADTVSASLLAAVRGVANIPDLLRWLQGIAQDPETLLAMTIVAGRLLCVLLLAFGCEFLALRMTRRLYRSLAADAREQESTASTNPAALPEHEPVAVSPVQRVRLVDGWLMLLRLPIIVMALTIDLLPPLAFLAIAYLLAGTPLVGSGDVRAAALAVIDAYVIVRMAGAVGRAAFGAPYARLRLLPVSDATARYLMRWVRRIFLVVIFGYAVSRFAVLFGMDEDTRQGVLRLISLLVHVMLIVMVIQCRASVAARLSGGGEGFFGTLRQRVASAWHIYAIIVIAAAWVIYAYEIPDGMAELLHFVLWTLVVALAARVADIVLVGGLDRGFALAHERASGFVHIEARASRYHQPLRILLRVAIAAVAFVFLAQVLGFDVGYWFGEGAPGGRLANSLVTLLVTLGVAIALWEAINVGMQAYLDRLTQEGAAVRAARLQTIVPLLRNSLLIVLMVLIGLTAMSELGVNIGPLLAGASIFGVAIGFGSQKLVQDFITGIFLLLENAMQVGDFVTAGGLSGTVENLSIRTLRLRAGDGSVHVIPFSSVSTVTNSNRGLGNASVAVTVDYQEDSEHVAGVLTGIVKEMRDDKAFATGMLSDLQLWGVDRVDGATMTLAGQIVCSDSARWGVQREFNRRVKIAFQKEGIRMMPVNTTVTALQRPFEIKMAPSGKATPAAYAMPDSEKG
ncbi:MAG TPA: mechanosensitive ion channel domain-containing protein, partial [Acetobacteraceae bacterium]|nr:mechanosensitive ion channel domain-containing protein [Acetobacteraceae bacterium]